jgi:acyl-CoA thioester hydrolase
MVDFGSLADRSSPAGGKYRLAAVQSVTAMPQTPFSHRLTVRFRDCDMMGHANHAVYFTYMEQCRFALWRELGGGTGLPGAATIIVHAECDYRAPALMHDELEVRLTVGDLGRSSFTFHYEIVNIASGLRVAAGKTVNVTFDYAASRSIPIPESTRALLERMRC